MSFQTIYQAIYPWRIRISGVRLDGRTQSPDFNEAIGILPSIGISAVFKKNHLKLQIEL